MRYPPEQKAGTRRKIVEAASKSFRKHGVEGASVSDIMADADLTVGGFYRHFDSKEELFQEALEKAMGESLVLMQNRREHASGEGSSGTAWAKRAASVYLSEDHRRMRAAGCPLPELTAEVVRRPKPVQQSFEGSLGRIVDEVAKRLNPDDPDATKPQAWGFVSTLVGSLLLARGVDDESLANEILSAGRSSALAVAHPEKTP